MLTVIRVDLFVGSYTVIVVIVKFFLKSDIIIDNTVPRHCSFYSPNIVYTLSIMIMKQVLNCIYFQDLEFNFTESFRHRVIFCYS